MPIKWRGLVARVVLAVCIFVFVSEGLIRVRHWLKHGDLWGVEETYTRDPVSGLRIPIPNSQFGPIRINTLGFRGPELVSPKPQETIRLAFLGASTTYCAEVSSNEMTWPHLVWQDLHQRLPKVAIDYVNGGVPGYSINASLRNLGFRISELEPDVIVIYHGYNDLFGNSFHLAKQRGLVEQRPMKEQSELSKYSLLWYLIEKNVRIAARQTEGQSKAEKLVFDKEELTEPFRVDLAALIEASLKVADVVAVATISPRMRSEQTSAQQVEAAVTALYYMPYMSIEGILVGYDVYNEAIKDVVLDTAAILVGNEESIPGDSAHFADSVHFTDAGSKAMAKRVSSALFDAEKFQELVDNKQPAQ